MTKNAKKSEGTIYLEPALQSLVESALSFDVEKKQGQYRRKDVARIIGQRLRDNTWWQTEAYEVTRPSSRLNTSEHAKDMAEVQYKDEAEVAVIEEYIRHDQATLDWIHGHDEFCKDIYKQLTGENWEYDSKVRKAAGASFDDF